MDELSRLEKLEKALIVANEVLEAGEGIDLLYYLVKWTEEFEIIKSVLDQSEAKERLP